MKKLHYTELGLVNTRAMFAQAMEEQFEVPQLPEQRKSYVLI